MIHWQRHLSYKTLNLGCDIDLIYTYIYIIMSMGSDAFAKRINAATK